jgi:hypothetical protein
MKVGPGTLKAMVVSNLPTSTRVRYQWLQATSYAADADFQIAGSGEAQIASRDGTPFELRFSSSQLPLGFWELLVSTTGLGPATTQGDFDFDQACGGNHRPGLATNPQRGEALSTDGSTFWSIHVLINGDGTAR